MERITRSGWDNSGFFAAPASFVVAPAAVFAAGLLICHVVY